MKCTGILMRVRIHAVKIPFQGTEQTKICMNSDVG